MINLASDGGGHPEYPGATLGASQEIEIPLTF
jgi:hypothetical protein